VTKFNLPHSMRKHLRREKARIRREILNPEEADKSIKELIEKAVEGHSKKRMNGNFYAKELT